MYPLHIYTKHVFFSVTIRPEAKWPDFLLFFWKNFFEEFCWERLLTKISGKQKWPNSLRDPKSIFFWKTFNSDIHRLCFHWSFNICVQIFKTFSDLSNIEVWKVLYWEHSKPQEILKIINFMYLNFMKYNFKFT